MKGLKGSFHVRIGMLVLLVVLALAACRPAEEGGGEVNSVEVNTVDSDTVEVNTVEVNTVESDTVESEEQDEGAEGADPVAATEAFYGWYLTYSDPEQGRNALVDRAYRKSEYLSADLIEVIDGKLAQMEAEYGGAGFDPFLMAQALPQEVSVELWEAAGEEACVVVHQLFGETVHDLTVDLVVEDGAWKMDRIREGSPMTPDGVVGLFLQEYMAQVRASMDGGEPDMLQSGAYREHALLSPAFVAQVEAARAGKTVAGFEGGGYDPFLCAQDVPHAINVGEPVVEADAATVNVGRYYAGTPELDYMQVELVRRDGRWLINDIRPLLEAATDGEMTPAAVVEAFYAEWREWVTEGFAGERENPLMSGTYRESAYIAPAFADEVDAIVAGFEGGGYDPFLCAQDVPNDVVVDGTIFTESGPRVAVHTSFNNHAMVVGLEQGEGGEWRIRNVLCPGTPEGNAEIFYTWYLAYTRDCCVMGATDPGMLRNPLVDGAYHDAPYISPAFAAEVEAELAEMRAAGGGGYDPILQAQAFPFDFTVEAGEGEGVVIVDMAFANEHRLEVRMVQEDGQWSDWLVRSVRRMEVANPPTPAAAGPDTTGWTTVRDAENGFSFKIPPGWVAEEQDLQGPGMPDDWPVLQQYLVMPQGVADELASRSSPPKGNEMAPVPPFSVSFLYGDEAAFDRAFVTAAEVQVIEVNGRGIAVQRQSGNFSLPRYVFHSEDDPLRWVVVEDVVNEFPGREVQAAETFGVLDGILMTMSLDG